MEVLNKSHYANSHLQMRQNLIAVAEHSGHNLLNLYCFKIPQLSHTNQGGRLFEPRSKAINKLVFDESQEMFAYDVHGIAWIGINDRKTEGEFVYTSSGEKINFSVWGKDQPSKICNWGGWLTSLYYNEPCGISQSPHCLVIGYEDEKWWDGICQMPLNFICEIM